MDYIKKYKSFLYSHYLSEGLRITAGVLLPAFLMSFFNMLTTGIVISLGALFVSITDSPGPIHHRKNGMTVCTASLLIVSLITGFTSGSTLILAIFLTIACFFFSMLAIFGARAGSIGLASMIVITLTIDPHLQLSTPVLVMQHSLLIASGGLWYLCFSSLLYSFKPYRLAQQALGDYIEETATYLSIRAKLYNKGVNYEETFKQLMQQQAIVQSKQTELSELLFKTRSIVKEFTNVGRTLVMIYLEVADIFEKIIMSHQRYTHLHKFFNNTDILNDYYSLAQNLALEMTEAGIAVKSGYTSVVSNHLMEDITKAKEKLEKLRLTYLKPENIEGFISLRRIIENIEDIANRLVTLHKYTAYNTPLPKKKIKETDFNKLISHQEISPQLFFDNLTFKSDNFRHSLRLSIAVFVGYLLSNLLNIGHSYWVLLTIVVIVKPAFSLTKKRNGDRLAGTFLGILLGLIILYLIQHNTILLVLLILLMAGSYSFMRTNYFVSVFLMTSYLILFYHLLHPQDFSFLLTDRIIDTCIGSIIAFLASFFLFPLWERKKIKPVMIEMLEEVNNYFTITALDIIENRTNTAVQKNARKNALVTLANLSEAFNRMLAEPKSQQKGVEKLHQFVVLNHMLTSYIATLSHYTRLPELIEQRGDFATVAEEIKIFISEAIKFVNNEEVNTKIAGDKEMMRKLNAKANELLQKRKEELQQGLIETATRKSLFNLKSIVDQFNLIYNVAVDIHKTSQVLQLD